MVQVVTVSANTAAYAADAMRQPRRVSRSAYVEENKKAVDPKADTEEIPVAHIGSPVSDSTSSALNFLSAGQQPKRSTTLKATLDAYESF